ncbi:MAG: sugar phosphate isomerase/epimerase family protein [Planctomycetaceae bacterium]
MPVVVSCCAQSYGHHGAEAAVEHLRAAGLTHFELPIRTAGFVTRLGDPPLLNHDASATQLTRVQRLLERHGVELSSCNILSGNPLDPNVVEVTRRKLDLAADLGVTIVIGEAGQADTPDQQQVLSANLRQIGDDAADKNIVYCCETHPGLCREPDGMLRLMRELDHPHIRINFDTGNLLHLNERVDGEIALTKVCQYVRSVHLKDSRGEYQQWYFPALGCGGAVDFRKTLQILKGTGFSGPCSIEIQGIAGEGPLSLEDHQARVVQSVKFLRDCGYFDRE